MDDVDDGRLDRAGFLLGALALTAAADPGARLPGFESRLARLLLRDFTSEPQFPHLQSELQGADGRKCLEQGLAHSECWLSAW